MLKSKFVVGEFSQQLGYSIRNGWPDKKMRRHNHVAGDAASKAGGVNHFVNVFLTKVLVYLAFRPSDPVHRSSLGLASGALKTATSNQPFGIAYS